eukprot:CAMPEP_0202080044 /NCGR_PEP_ID=MMETSP0964-20121228/6819_1 /ASSEMBLY_ACC=CAM_ASM_000500 /TAXON_ID=4773 /ORGANISM="Schizochytrium aggregatum, Strain ATCC28209" /LENGTH=67 /DNA_ID=CAMNT_0048647401 /DNA_START=669 /DNA_END=868 /DNA_ORIENTATION=+
MTVQGIASNENVLVLRRGEAEEELGEEEVGITRAHDAQTCEPLSECRCHLLRQIRFGAGAQRGLQAL